MTSHAAIAACAILLVTSSAFFNWGCATNPATGKKELFLISESQEVEIGKQADASTIQSFGEYEDPELDAYVSGIGDRLAASSERPSLTWNFRVLDDPVVNAMALPGGYVYVTRGILAALDSEAQLAGVVGHEIGHVTARHGARQATREQLVSLGLGVGSILSEDFARYGQLAGGGIGLLFLKYGRGDETQADELAIRYTTRTGYDPREIPGTYATLKRLAERSGERLPTILSTHPDPGDRETTTRQLAQQAVAGRNTDSLRIGRATFLRQIDGIVYGENPRQGFVENGTYYHPDLRFQVTFPSGWKIVNMRRQVVGQQEGENGAGIALTIVPSKGMNAPSDYASYLIRQGAIADARGQSERVSGWPAWLGVVSARQSDGRVVDLYAAWIGREAGRFYQFIGGPVSGGGGYFSTTVRSMRELTIAEKLARQPDRLKIIEVQQATTTLEAVAAATPGLAVSLDELELLNGMSRDETVRRGTLVKMVRREENGSASSR